MKYFNILPFALVTALAVTGLALCGVCRQTGTGTAPGAQCEGAELRQSHGPIKQLGMLPTPATESATGGNPADGTAR